MGPQWIHEIKWDGWRLQAHKRADGVTLYSRPGRGLTARFPRIAEAIAALSRRSLVLDGELVAFDNRNQPDFHLLRRKGAPVVTFLFDILESNGADLRGRPWRERRPFLYRDSELRVTDDQSRRLKPCSPARSRRRRSNH